MSDATLPPPRSSSAAPASETGNRSDATLPEGYFDAPPDQPSSSPAKEEASGDSEGRTDSKQKRKRTSPKDQAILEAEYKQNPKPNKAARAEIVEKVDLNEKEVQIWFQNRRQINRRKSRPLLPHEIAAYGLGGMSALSSDPIPMPPYSSSQSAIDFVPNSQPEHANSQDQDDRSSCHEGVDVSHSAERPVSSQSEDLVPLASDNVSQVPPTPRPQGSSASSAPDAVSSSLDESVIKSFSSTPGYLANRWNTTGSSFSTPPSSHFLTSITPPIFTASQPTSCPERIDESVFTPSSSIRLSLSLDGRAELITSSPSPPHRHTPRPSSASAPSMPQKRMRGLQRSQSAFLFGRQSMNQTLDPFTPRLPTGRSKDTRTWESCCDSEARDALTLQAENESNGSAVAAISLIRSTSSSALKPNTNKRNAPSLDQSEAGKNNKKPKLGRAISSVARLQSPSKISSKQIQDPSGYAKDGLTRSPSGDSDKENWVPSEGGGNSRRRPLPSSRSSYQSASRTVLGDNHTVLSHASFGNSRSRKRRSANDSPRVFEDHEHDGDVPEDVEKFMRGEISPSKKGDLDCIQGLLSLSQGNWR